MRREHMIELLCDYAENEVIPEISDNNTKMVMDVLVKRFRKDKKVADSILNNPMVSFFLCPDDNGEYDMESIINTFEQSAQKYGSLTITLPKIKLLFPEEQRLCFGAGDFASLRGYL